MHLFFVINLPKRKKEENYLQLEFCYLDVKVIFGLFLLLI